MKEITVKEVEELINKKTSTELIDVREPHEVATGKIPGSVNIPLGTIEANLNKFDKSKEYIMICRSGARSGRATQYLNHLGVQAVNMAGGMLAWEGEVE